jgi:hypothetical protein
VRKCTVVDGRNAMLDVATVLGEAAAVVDPKGENEDVTVICGLVEWALTHPDEYDGWDAKSLSAALRWSFASDVELAEEIADRLVDPQLS